MLTMNCKRRGHKKERKKRKGRREEDMEGREKERKERGSKEERKWKLEECTAAAAPRSLQK